MKRTQETENHHTQAIFGTRTGWAVHRDEAVTRSTIVHLLDVYYSLYMANRETDKPLLLNAMLESKDEVAMMR